jgi:hypothetical protein
MRLIDVLELDRAAGRRRWIYFTILVSFTLVLTAVTWVRLGQDDFNKWLDFQYFYVVGKLVWLGRLEDAYYSVKFEQIVRQLGDDAFLPWTYPPQFALIIAPITALPLASSYLLFMTTSLAAYLLVLSRLNQPKLAAVLFFVFPAILMNAKIGQNGFLTGALIGWACVLLVQGRWCAGLPLGLLVIKPHVAVSLAIYALAMRQWKAIAVAVVTVIFSCAVATFIFGPAIWLAFLNGVREASLFLEHQIYPFFSMVSFFAALCSFGVPAPVAIFGQGLLAFSVLGSIVFAVQKLPSRQALGLSVVATLLISPYANSYDAVILAVGFAVILPDLMRLGSVTERLTIYLATMLSSGYALIASAASHGEVQGLARFSPSGFGFVLVYVLCLRILLRSTTQGAKPQNGSEAQDLSAPA